MAGPARRAIAVAVTAFTPLTACASAPPATPTATQAGETLKNHVTRTLKGALAQDVEVTDPGGEDVPCGDGTVRRTYAARGRDPAGSGDPGAIVIALAGALDFVAEYDAVAASSGNRQELASGTFRTRITLSSPARHLMVVSGETECLPPG